MAKASPIATMKSRISVRLGRRGRTGPRFRRRRRRREIAEEIGLGTDERAGRPAVRPAAEAVLIGLHRAVEREEFRVRAVSFGEDAVALAVAFAADLLGLLLSLRCDDGDFAVRFGLDLLALLRSLRTIGCRPLLALGLHAAEYGLRVLRRQVGALNAHVDDGEAKALGAGDHLVADVGHQRVALVAHDVGDRGPRQRAPERRVQHAAELRVGAAGVEDGLVKEERIGDAVAHERVDLKPLVVRHQHFLALVVERENALVDVDNRVDERPLEVKARSADQVAHRLAEAQHQRLLDRVDDEYRHRGQNDDDDRQEDDREAAKRPSHFTPPTWTAGNRARYRAPARRSRSCRRLSCPLARARAPWSRDTCARGSLPAPSCTARRSDCSAESGPWRPEWSARDTRWP